jgi:hypothetical protein
MKKVMTFFGASLVALMFLAGCDLLKSEDEKIKDALIGKYYEEDDIDEDGNKIKDVKGEFFADGKFKAQATLEIVDEETFETTDLQVKISGEWKIKDKFIYYTYDYDKLKITPGLYMLMKDELIKAIKDENTPDKVIEYDASKIIYEDSDGKRYTMKKSY